MHHKKTLFTNYHHHKRKLYINRITNGFKVVRVGDIFIMYLYRYSYTLKSILYIPKLKYRLISLNNLAFVGFNTTIMKYGYIVTNEEFRIHSSIKNEFCIWNGKTVEAISDITD